MNATKAPKVSVVLTTYNRAARLPMTLDRILAQTLKDFEVVVSDDCSSDETAAIVREYARLDPRVRYRRNEQNLKMPGNLNAGIAETRGEYIANLHDGDVYRSDLLERWFGVLDRHPRAGFVFNQYEVLDHKGCRRLHKQDMPECMDGREFLRRVFVRQWGSPVYGTVMARRSCYEAVGPFDPRFSFDSDIEMWVRLASWYDVAYVAEPLILVTPREANHLMAGHSWWECTNDVRVKRLAMRVVYPPPHRAHFTFEIRARAHYAWLAFAALRHCRWADVRMAVYLAMTGRDNLLPPY